MERDTIRTLCTLSRKKILLGVSLLGTKHWGAIQSVTLSEICLSITPLLSIQLAECSAFRSSLRNLVATASLGVSSLETSLFTRHLEECGDGIVQSGIGFTSDDR